MDIITTLNGGVYVDLGDIPSPGKKGSPGNFIDLVQLEAELSQDTKTSSRDVGQSDQCLGRGNSWLASSTQRVTRKPEDATLAEMREELRVQAALVRASRSNTTVADHAGGSGRGKDGNMHHGLRPNGCMTSMQQPGSACSEPFPEPASDSAVRQPHSVSQNSSAALCAELPPSPLSPARSVQSKAVASKASTQSSFLQDLNIACVQPKRESSDDGSATFHAELSKVREQMASFNRHGRRQISALEDDLRALLQQQEEVEALAANVATLVLAESSTQTAPLRAA